ncbi:hypothetical protein RUM43_010088 [Polyplax serrata]|uniref:Ammonium transporter n=1 Tax=Polyplax serrata TaxID=468196 RepID=A0AAN8Q4A2_POLSC
MSSSEKEININNTKIPAIYQLNQEDTNWLITSSFIIFTMQTGFGLLESGCISLKNEVNIMMKNIVDIVLGGFTYWLFGYGLSFGRSPYTNSFIAFGDFAVDADVGDPLMGPRFAAFIFQLSFATTATTIVSGAMAERCNFKAYCLFSFLNTVVYCVPAGWVWGEHGFLNKLGVVDIAGSGPVHVVGGGSAFASAFMLGPRLGRYINGTGSLPLGSPINCCMGLFVLWWGWLAFNSGSTYGLSGSKWGYAAKACVNTMLSSFGGGLFGLIYSLAFQNGSVDILHLINGVLGSLVAVTAGCYLYHSWESILIGFVGAFLSCIGQPWFDHLGLDDPVGASSVHGLCGIWGVISVGLFAVSPEPLTTTNGRNGLFYGGGWYLLGVQCLACMCLGAWAIITTLVLLWFVNIIIPIRMKEYEELLGADLVEHHILHKNVGVHEAMTVLYSMHDDLKELKDVPEVGNNPGHEAFLRGMYSQVSGKELFVKNSVRLDHLDIFTVEENARPEETYTRRITPKKPSTKRFGWI